MPLFYFVVDCFNILYSHMTSRINKNVCMYHLSISFYHAINVLRSKNIRPSLGATGEEILDGEEGGGEKRKQASTVKQENHSKHHCRNERQFCMRSKKQPKCWTRVELVPSRDRTSKRTSTTTIGLRCFSNACCYYRLYWVFYSSYNVLRLQVSEWSIYILILMI